MRLAVFSDVHGNLEALDTFLAEVEGRVDGFINLGDTVGYGPSNDECLERVHALDNAVLLRGNHEEIFETGDLSHCSALATRFYSESSKHFTRGDLLHVREEERVGGWVFRHTFQENGRWLYVYDADRVPGELSADYVIGHTHYQRVIEKDGHRVVNPGSVGQNRADMETLCYAIFDLEAGTYDLRSRRYDLARFVDSMRQHDYPEDLIAYYLR